MPGIQHAQTVLDKDFYRALRSESGAQGLSVSKYLAGLVCLGRGYGDPPMIPDVYTRDLTPSTHLPVPIALAQPVNPEEPVHPDEPAPLPDTIEIPVVKEVIPLTQECVSCQLKDRDIAHAQEKIDALEKEHVRELEAAKSKAATQVENANSRARQLEAQLQEAAVHLQNHGSIEDLMNCPNCGETALKQFHEKGGIILTPGFSKEDLLTTAQQHIPQLGAPINIPDDALHGLVDSQGG